MSVPDPSRIPLPVDRLLERMNLGEPPPGSTVLETLDKVNVRPRMVDDFRPVSESLEWRLSEMHWNAAGIISFLDNGVPYTINNSGALSQKTAAVLMEACREQPPAGELRILEVGAGTGLFARYLLDQFRDLCRRDGRDYYDRAVFYVTDRSPRTVQQWEERALFAPHAAHVRLSVCDATHPGVVRRPDGTEERLSGLRAVLCNYVLDSLPTTVLRRGEGGIEELQIRTHLIADLERLRQYTDLDLEGFRRLASSSNPEDCLRLLPLLNVLEFETAYRETSRLPPYANEAVSFAAGLERITLNHGAFSAIEEMLKLLEPDGFILLNDYGPTTREQLAEHGAIQRFGPSTAVGVSFPLLDHHFGLQGTATLRPDGDEKLPIHPRLLAASVKPALREAFLKYFGLDYHNYLDQPSAEARKEMEAGRGERAMSAYKDAIARCQYDWRLLGEVAEFLIRRVGDYHAGLEVARAAIATNPWYSSWLWNVLGDALYALDRFAEAHECYLQAQRIDPNDARTCLNLAYSYTELGKSDQALAAIATGLASDGNGGYRNRFLEKQHQILGRIAGRWNEEQEWLARRHAQLR